MAKLKKSHHFSGSRLQWAETAKNGFKCFKMHSNTYSPKRAKKCQKMFKNVRKLKNNCKISEITKYGEQMTKIYNNV